jgi:hypothetical protein
MGEPRRRGRFKTAVVTGVAAGIPAVVRRTWNFCQPYRLKEKLHNFGQFAQFGQRCVYVWANPMHDLSCCGAGVQPRCG